MYDPPEIHSQCVDVSSSPCYVNVSDIPYEMFKGTIFQKRDKLFFENIRNESIYADTCNQEWKKGDWSLYYKSFDFTLIKKCLNENFKKGDTITIKDIKEEYQELKEIFNEFENLYCSVRFLILADEEGEGYPGKMILEKHVMSNELESYWFNKDPNHYFYYYDGCLMVMDIFANLDTEYDTAKHKLVLSNNFIELKMKELTIYENITIYDCQGTKKIETTIKGNLTNIDISSLSRGIYFVKINNKIYKFMKE